MVYMAGPPNAIVVDGAWVVVPMAAIIAVSLPVAPCSGRSIGNVMVVGVDVVSGSSLGMGIVVVVEDDEACVIGVEAIDGVVWSV